MKYVHALHHYQNKNKVETRLKDLRSWLAKERLEIDEDFIMTYKLEKDLKMICKDLRRLEKYLKILKRDFKRYQK